METSKGFYEMTIQPRGLCVIINNFDYSRCGLPSLLNASEAENEIRQAFSKVFFTVECRQNLTAGRLQHALAEIATSDHSSAQCFVCYILAHGERGNIVGVDGKQVHLLHMVDCFTPRGSPTLRDKPKVFILDVCGHQHALNSDPNTNTNTNTTTTSTSERIITSIVPRPPAPDFLFAFATIPTATSNEKKTNSSSCGLEERIFAQTFSHLLQKNASLLDLVQIMGMMDKSITTVFLTKAAENDKSSDDVDVATSEETKPESEETENKSVPVTGRPQLQLQECVTRSTMHKRLLMVRQEITASNEAPAEIQTDELLKVDRGQSVMIVGGTHSCLSWDAQCSCEVFNEVANDWRTMADLHHKRYEAAAVSLKGVVFVCGGLDETRKALKSVEKYNSDLNVWTVLPDMLHARNGHSLVTSGGRLFAVGGVKSPMVELFDRTKNTWSEFIAMSGERSALTCVSISTGLLVIGGKDENGAVLNTCELLNIKRKEWQSVVPLNKERCFAASAVYNESVFVFGGEDDDFNALDSVEQFSVSTNSWFTLSTKLRIGRFGLGATLVGEKVFIAGGRDDSDTQSIVEVFDVTEKIVLSKFFRMSESLYGLAMVTL